MSSICLGEMNIDVQRAENPLHVFGKRRLKFHKGFFLGMNKTDARGVKHLPFHSGYQRGVLFHEASFEGVGSVTINRIPHQGMPQMGEMNTNLVCSAGFNGDRQKGKPLLTISNLFPQGQSVSTAAFGDGHLFSTNGMPGDGKGNSPTFMGSYAMDQGNIFFFDGSIFELLRKHLMGHIVFGDNHES